jgi:predicted nucleotidyltransferase component of viral defense system
LLSQALRLIDEVAAHGRAEPFWTFGGGTVLMLRYLHRHSKDIDIFVPDPQYLGHVTPRLSDVADDIAADYVEGAGYVKLIAPEGEIDFVASRNLTPHPFEEWAMLGRTIRVETAVEVVAKKLWHRGEQATARDLFDLSLVIEREPRELAAVGDRLVRHRTAFLAQLVQRADILSAQFEAIRTLTYKPTYEEAARRATTFLEAL